MYENVLCVLQRENNTPLSLLLYHYITDLQALLAMQVTLLPNFEFYSSGLEIIDVKLCNIRVFS